MSEGPFRGNAAAREARLAALEAELATLRAARGPSVLEARERAKIKRLTADLEKSRAKERRLRERLMESESPRGSRLRMLWCIFEMIMTLVFIGGIIAQCRAARREEPSPAVAATDYVVQPPPPMLGSRR